MGGVVGVCLNVLSFPKCANMIDLNEGMKVCCWSGDGDADGYHPFWVRAFLYNRDTHGNLNIIKLNPTMYGVGTEYLYGTERDFFYMTRFVPPPPPQVSAHAHETTAQ